MNFRIWKEYGNPICIVWKGTKNQFCVLKWATRRFIFCCFKEHEHSFFVLEMVFTLSFQTHGNSFLSCKGHEHSFYAVPCGKKFILYYNIRLGGNFFSCRNGHENSDYVEVEMGIRFPLFEGTRKFVYCWKQHENSFVCLASKSGRIIFII